MIALRGGPSGLESFISLLPSAKNVINPLTGATTFAPSILQEIIAPAESEPANTNMIPVKMIATVM